MQLCIHNWAQCIVGSVKAARWLSITLPMKYNCCTSPILNPSSLKPIFYLFSILWHFCSFWGKKPFVVSTPPPSFSITITKGMFTGCFKWPDDQVIDQRTSGLVLSSRWGHPRFFIVTSCSVPGHHHFLFAHGRQGGPTFLTFTLINPRQWLEVMPPAGCP